MDTYLLDYCQSIKFFFFVLMMESDEQSTADSDPENKVIGLNMF